VTVVKAVVPLLVLLALLGGLPAAAQTPTQPGGLPTMLPPLAQPPPGTGGFLGGVPSGTATSEVITIGVIDAISRAIQHNLGTLQAEAALGRAEGARWRMLSELLPNVSARVTETRQVLNLKAFGFGAPGGPSFPGLPDLVGPFNVFDARVFVTQSVVDLSALNDARSASHSAAAAKLTRQSARDFVIHVAADLYVQALAASARADSARAQLETATALYKQAQDLKAGGLIAGVDELRAEVEMSVEQQRATAARNDSEKAKLQLARVIGLPLGQPFTLDANLPELPPVPTDLDQAVEQAYRTRPDYQAAIERVRAAEATRAAIVGSALPSVKVNADYGEIGLAPSDAKGSYSVAGAVQIPIFQGGRTHGKLLEADADLRARRAEADDLKASIYYQVRTAFLDLEATSEQLQVATRGRDLAAQTLAQSRDRFAAGIASNIEVVQAQEAVALANEQFIAAQYGYDLAKGAVIRGVGATEAVLQQILGGTR